jgi:hypothetical protein
MEGFKAFMDFFIDSDGDTRLAPVHLWLYMALLHQWAASCFETPLVIRRDELLRVVRVSRKTYHKCMRELHAYGYIVYVRSFDPFKSSVVYISKPM